MFKSIIVLAALFLSVCVFAADDERTVFENSVLLNILREPSELVKDATDTDENLVMSFRISFKTRNKEELRARAEKGERISNADLKEKYLPLDADMDIVVKYLKDSGFEVKKSLLGVSAKGKVSLIEKILDVKFKDVKIEGETYHWIINAPSLPKSISEPVLGVLGLQDFPLRRH